MRVSLTGLSVILTACSPRSATRFEETAPPPVFNERSVDEPTRGVHGIQPGECPAQTGELPVPYFEDRLLIRLPAGANEDNVVEFGPGFARNTQAIESATCHEGMPGPLIDFMALALLPEQPMADRPLALIRDDTLEAFGYPETRLLIEQDEDPDGSSGMWVYEIAADESQPNPSKILFAMQVAHGQTAALVFEVHPNAWSIIVDTLVASAKHFSMLSP